MASFSGRILVLIAVLFLAAVPVLGESVEDRSSPRNDTTRNNPWKRWWIASTIALAAGSALDFSSSIGKQETNPALRGANGQFSMGRSFAIKGGVAVGLVISQRWFMRHHADASVEKTAALANFAGAGVMTTVAIRNRGIGSR